MLFGDFLFFSSAGHLVQWSGTIAAFLDFRLTEQVSAQGDQRFGKRCRKLIFKMAAVAATLDFLSVHVANLCLLSALMLLIKFQFNWIIEEMSKTSILNTFPYKCTGPIQMHGEANLTLPFVCLC